MKPNRLTSILGALLGLSLLAAGPVWATENATEYTDAACIECHRTGSTESDLHIAVDAYQASIHSQELTCQSCHSSVVDDTHMSEEGSGGVDCSDCHDQDYGHGPENERLACHDCHTRHDIRAKSDPVSAVHPDQWPVTCGECHPVAAGKTDYFTWFPAFQIASHSKGDFANRYEKDNCLGCHQGAGAHGEPEPINDQTCYKCHGSPDSAGALWGRMHPVADRQRQPAVFAAASIYQALGLLGVLIGLGSLFRARAPAISRKKESPAGKGGTGE